jgi:hypothetical protein
MQLLLLIQHFLPDSVPLISASKNPPVDQAPVQQTCVVFLTSEMRLDNRRHFGLLIMRAALTQSLRSGTACGKYNGFFSPGLLFLFSM